MELSGQYGLVDVFNGSCPDNRVRSVCYEIDLRASIDTQLQQEPINRQQSYGLLYRVWTYKFLEIHCQVKMTSSSELARSKRHCFQNWLKNFPHSKAEIKPPIHLKQLIKYSSESSGGSVKPHWWMALSANLHVASSVSTWVMTRSPLKISSLKK